VSPWPGRSVALAGLVAAASGAGAEPRAVALAESVLERLGGRDAWQSTRYLTWEFFGKRRHAWDRRTGDVRIEAGDRVVLMNLGTRAGRAFEKGVEVADPQAKTEALESGYAQWVNDSYWLLMPYKLLDPGARLEYRGESALPDGRAADLVGLTFEPGTGLTPENRYDVWIARDTGLVEQWAYYASASDTTAVFTLPWGGWTRCGGVLLPTEHGRGEPWEVAAPESLPRALFESP
jgi:hypothetical protein